VAARTSSSKLVYVTGHKELDLKLRLLPDKLQRKFVRGALRKCAKRVVRDTQNIVRAEAYNEGVLYRALKVKSLKRSRVRVGTSVFIDREKLFAAYQAKYGHPPHPAKGRNDPFYYPAVIEFGSDTKEPVKPMRRALYDNANELRALFAADVKQFIAENKVTLKLPKATK
jgi:hypothetical protein